jgi:hypothetical protein
MLAPRALPDRGVRTPTVDPDSLPRRRTRATTRAGQRSNRTGLLLAGIVVAFLLAFFSLAQTIRVSATGYDIDRLLVERDQFEAQRQELMSDLSRLGREPAIRKQASTSDWGSSSSRSSCRHGRSGDRSMTGRTDSRGRLIVLLAVFVVVATGLVGRLAYWQVLERDRLAGLAIAQTELRLEEPSRRGTIYDRSGTVVLATTIERSRLAASPDQLTPQRRAEVAEAVVGILGLEGEVALRLTDRMASEKSYVVLARDLGEATTKKIRDGIEDGTLAGLALESEPVRVYPQAGGAAGTTLAAHLLGFVNREGVGQYGAEQRYQEILAGQPRIAIADRDVAGRPVSGSERIIEAGMPGADLRLTIDSSLQLAVEQELLAAWIATTRRTSRPS